MDEDYFTLESFPSQTGEKIDLPDIAELIMTPFFRNADIHDVYKYGGEHLKKLILASPLTNSKKHVLLDYHVQLLSPGYRAVFNKVGNETEWHLDGQGAPFNNSETIHLLLSDCQSATEFNTNPVKIPMEDIDKCSYLEFIAYLNDNQEYLGLSGRKMETSKFITFSNHVHRGINPVCNEFRMFFRLIETDSRTPSALSSSSISHINIYKKEDSIREYKSIEKFNDKIILNIKPYDLGKK